MTSLAVHQYAPVFSQISQQVWLYLVLFVLGIVSRPLATVIAPGLFDHALLAQKVGALDRALFIGSFENETISEIQGEDAGFFPSERRDERSC